jgi:hypothetical protein
MAGRFMSIMVFAKWSAGMKMSCWIPPTRLFTGRNMGLMWLTVALTGFAGDILLSDGIELVFMRKNGYQFWGLVTGTELRDNSGQPIG